MSATRFVGLKRVPRVLLGRLGLLELARRHVRRTQMTPVTAIGRREGWEAALRWALQQGERSLFVSREFHAALRADTNMDIPTEHLLVTLRRAILLDEVRTMPVADLDRLVATLARQACCNAYVWRVTPEERRRVLDLLDEVRTARESGVSVNWQIVARLCMYERPESVLGDAQDIGELLRLVEIEPGEFREFISEYAVVRAREFEKRAAVESVGRLTRSASLAVAANYEAHPYPRWVRLRGVNPLTTRDALLEHFSADELRFLDAPFDALEAGCGTGYGVVEYARRFPSARITAVDFSSASIGYAAMMADVHGISSVRFLRMDLLDLPQRTEEFDVVRSIGVLHHLGSPIEGGRALVSRLKRGGIVHWSLYSRASRRELVRLREKYALSAEMDDDHARELRYRILTEEPATVDDGIPLRADFFDLDRCRDLLFHPLEHTFTVPMVRELVEGCDLEFRGLGRPALSPNHLWTRYPRDGHWRDWGAWEEFEERYPDAFGNLYQILARKA